MVKQSKLLAFSTVLSLSLVACGGGGGGGGSSVSGPSYSGSTTPAAFTASNAEPVETSAADASAQIVSAETALNASPIGIASENDSLVPSASIIRFTVDVARNAATQSQAQNLPLGLTFTAEQLNSETGTMDYCGGSVSIPDNTNFNSSTLDITMTFNNLCVNDGINPEAVLNGTLRLIESDTAFSIIYSNFTMTMNGQTFHINASVACDTSGTSCDVDFVGSDGKTYRIGDLNTGGNETTGYYVSGTFYHPTYGAVEMSTTTPMTFNCAPGPQPDTGELSFTGNGGTSGRIVFGGCSGYSYCYNEGSGEVCNSGTW